MTSPPGGAALLSTSRTVLIFVLCAAVGLSAAVLLDALTWGVNDFGTAALVSVSPSNLVAPLVAGLACLVAQRLARPGFDEYLATTARGRRYVRLHLVAVGVVAAIPIVLAVLVVVGVTALEPVRWTYWTGQAALGVSATLLFAVAAGSAVGALIRNPMAPALTGLAYWGLTVANISGVSPILSVGGLTTGETAGLRIAQVVQDARLVLVLISGVALAVLVARAVLDRTTRRVAAAFLAAAGLLFVVSAVNGARDEIEPDPGAVAGQCTQVTTPSAQGVVELCVLPEHAGRLQATGQALVAMQPGLLELGLVGQRWSVDELTPYRAAGVMAGDVDRSAQQRLSQFATDPDATREAVLRQVMYPPECRMGASPPPSEEAFSTVAGWLARPQGTGSEADAAAIRSLLVQALECQPG